MRDRLIELIGQIDAKCGETPLCEDCPAYGKGASCINYYIADHLIANGVTVQEWISVKDRLPNKDVLVLCIGKRGGMFLGESPHLFSDGTAYFSVPNARSCRYATHWMPLPQPPKGE